MSLVEAVKVVLLIMLIFNMVAFIRAFAGVNPVTLRDVSDTMLQFLVPPGYVSMPKHAVAFNTDEEELEALDAGDARMANNR